MSDGILERNERDPLAGQTPPQIEEELRRALRGRVEAAYVFGSFGTPDFGPDSDIDLILVTPTSKCFVERGKEFFDLRDITPAIEYLVYTPQEFLRLTTNPSPGFWASVTQNLRRLI